MLEGAISQIQRQAGVAETFYDKPHTLHSHPLEIGSVDEILKCDHSNESY